MRTIKNQLNLYKLKELKLSDELKWLHIKRTISMLQSYLEPSKQKFIEKGIEKLFDELGLEFTTSYDLYMNGKRID